MATPMKPTPGQKLALRAEKSIMPVDDEWLYWADVRFGHPQSHRARRLAVQSVAAGAGIHPLSVTTARRRYATSPRLFNVLS